MAGGSINWFVVIPDAARNYVANPSYEFGTAGWAGTATATLGSSSASQVAGAWALTATGATLGLGAATGVANTAAGTAYTASAYVRLTGTNSAGSVQINLGGTSYRTQVGTDWTRISVGSVNAVGSVALQRYSGAEGTLWVDAVQVEVGSITTYVDGDQDGGVWEGAPHASASYRGAQTRSGGSVWPLATVGLRPQTTPDTGMAPASNILQSYAVNSGAEYQRGRYTERTFTLTATMTGTTLADQHVTRRRVIDAIKRERVTPDQPTRFLYTGAAGTQYIDAYYDAGMGWGGENVIADENAAVRFVAPDPMWYGMEQEGTSLAPYTVIGTFASILYRDPDGRWGTMANSGSSLTGGPTFGVAIVKYVNGTVFAGGDFSGAGGTQAIGIAQHVNGNWGTLTGGTLSFAGGAGGAIVTAILPLNNGGTIIVAGGIDRAAGTNGTAIAQWVGGAWGTLAGGSVSGDVSNTPVINTLAARPAGGFYAGGVFLAAGGTTTRGIAIYNGAWGTLAGGTLNTASGGGVASALVTMSGSLVVTGNWGSVAGSVTPQVAVWSPAGSWGTLVSGTFNTGANQRNNIAEGPDTTLYFSGTVGGYTLNTGFARYRNILAPLGSAVDTASGGNFVKTAPNGNIMMGGRIFTINGNVPITFPLITWNGYAYLPPDLISSISGTLATQLVRSIDFAPTGTMYAGGLFDGQGTAASVTTLVTSGMAESYPTLRVFNRAAVTSRVYQLLNTTTGDGLWFNYIMQPGEIVTLTTTPGNRSFTSSVRGNIFGAILGGSNIASWRLLPGTNTVSFLADNPSVQADLFWTPRSSSIDGGAPGVI